MFDPFVEYISPEQEVYIDNLFKCSNQYYNIDIEELSDIENEFYNGLGGLTFNRAQEIIDYLNENKITSDLDGMMNERLDREEFYD